MSHSKRMEDRDFANRFIAFYLINYLEYKPDLDTFLNNGLTKVKDDSTNISQIKLDFKKSMNLAYEIFGNDAFRKRLGQNDNRKPINKSIFDALISKRQQIESDFGNQLEWERMDDKRMSRIKYELSEVSVFHEEDWERMIQFMCGVVPKFETAFKKPISQLSRR